MLRRWSNIPHQRNKPAEGLHFSPSTVINPWFIYSFTWKLRGVWLLQSWKSPQKTMHRVSLWGELAGCSAGLTQPWVWVGEMHFCSGTVPFPLISLLQWPYHEKCELILTRYRKGKKVLVVLPFLRAFCTFSSVKWKIWSPLGEVGLPPSAVPPAMQGVWTWGVFRVEKVGRNNVVFLMLCRLTLVRVVNLEIFLPCSLWLLWLLSKTHELESHHPPSILPRIFWDQQLTVFTALHNAPAAAIQSCLGFGQCLLSSLEMVLIIGAQEPIMATVIVTTSHPRMMCWGDCSASTVAASEALDRLHTLYLICAVNNQFLTSSMLLDMLAG